MTDTEDLLQSIDVLGLSPRTLSCLRGANIEFLADLIQKSPRELGELEFFGRRANLEVTAALRSRNLKLATKLSPAQARALAPHLEALRTWRDASLEQRMERVQTRLDTRFFRPRRPHLEALRPLIRAHQTGREAWRVLSESGRLAPLQTQVERLFVAPKRSAGHKGAVRFSAPYSFWALPYPVAREAALLFGADPEGLAQAEAQALLAWERLSPWRANPVEEPSAPKIVWRLSSGPIDRSAFWDRHAAWPAGARAAAEVASSALACPKLGIPKDGYQRAHQQNAAALCWKEAAEQSAKVPSKLSQSSVFFSNEPQDEALPSIPSSLVGRPLQALEDPFEPLAKIWHLGYGVTRLDAALIVLTAPLNSQQTASEHQRKRGMYPPKLQREARLREAVAFGKLETARALIAAGVSATGTDRKGRTPLHHAWQLMSAPDNIRRRFVELLLKAGADLEARDLAGDTPLHAAVRTKALPTLQTLLEAGADPNTRDNPGLTPLHTSVAQRHTDAIKDLVAAGADIEAEGPLHDSPLMFAVLLHSSASIEALIELGANINHPNIDGETPSSAAVDRNFRSVQAQLQASERVPWTRPTSPAPLVQDWPSELIANIQAHPERTEGWQVFSDWLLEREDPRGELIALGLKAKTARGVQRQALLTKLAHHEQRNARAAHGQLPHWTRDRRTFNNGEGALFFHFRWGILRGLTSTMTTAHIAKPLAALLQAQLMSFVEELKLRDWQRSPNFGSLLAEAAPLPSLRHLTLINGRASTPETLERFAPRLDTLSLKCRSDFPRSFAHPTVRVLRYLRRVDVEVLRASTLQTPKLKRLEVDLSQFHAPGHLAAMLKTSILKERTVRTDFPAPMHPPPSTRINTSARYDQLEALEVRCQAQHLHAAIDHFRPLQGELKRLRFLCTGATREEKAQLERSIVNAEVVFGGPVFHAQSEL